MEDAIEALLPSAGALQRDHALHGLRRRVEAARAQGATTIARAFEIADEAMFELLLSEGVLSDGVDSTCIGFCSDDGQEVQTLAEAREAMRDAFEWLQPRGYVELAADKVGEFIQVLRRPGEDT